MKIKPADLQKLQTLKGEWLRANSYSQPQAWALALQEADANPKTKDRARYARWLLARASGMLQASVVESIKYLNSEHLNTAFRYVWDKE